MFRKITFICLMMITVMSCKQSKIIQKPIPEQKKQLSNYDLLTGDWRLTRCSAFMTLADLEKMPDYSTEKVVYSIVAKDYKLMVNREAKQSEHDYSLPSGEYMIWANRSMLKIDESLYMYHVDGDKLILDSNYDPSYGPDDMVYFFERIN